MDIHPSRQLLVFILFIHIGAIAAVLALPFPNVLLILIVLALIGSFIQNVRYFILRPNAQAILQLRFDPHKKWYLLRRDRQLLTVQLLENSVCTTLVSVLSFKVQEGKERGKKYSVIMFKDSVDPVQYRRLRMLIHSVSY